MTGEVRRIVKDGLRALAVWAVIAVVLVALFQYSGWIIAQLIGFIFVVAFVALRSAELLYFVLKPFGAGGRPPPLNPPDPSGGGTSSQGTSKIPCPTCQRSGRMKCPICLGARGRNEMPQTAGGASQWVPCGYCTQSGSVQCTSCSGTGYLNA
jgi:hypothetical protein